MKELLEQSIRYGRMLDSDHLPLQHFFIVLEHVLRHGLKPKKGLLGPKKELWDILQSVEKYCYEAHDITASVRDLPTVRTHMGRARAWLRIALMQKKLADYLQALMERRDEALAEYYEPHALMMSDEVITFFSNHWHSISNGRVNFQCILRRHRRSGCHYNGHFGWIERDRLQSVLQGRGPGLTTRRYRFFVVFANQFAYKSG